MFSLRSLITIAVILFIPFILRMRGIEPYPAILLPSGAFVLQQQNNRVDLEYKLVYARDSAGEWTPIHPDSLLAPIPLQYFFPIVDHEFGLGTDSALAASKRLKLLRKLHIINSTCRSAKQDQEVQTWLQQRLIAQHLSPDAIRICTYTKTVSTASKQQTQNLKNEKIIYLVK